MSVHPYTHIPINPKSRGPVDRYNPHDGIVAVNVTIAHAATGSVNRDNRDIR